MLRLFFLSQLCILILSGCNNQPKDIAITTSKSEIERERPLNQINNDLAQSMSLEDFEKNLNSYTAKQYELVPKEEINFSSQSGSDNFSYYPTYFEQNGQSYFITWNESENAIEVYDLESKALHKKITHKAHSEWELRNVQFINFDSIFVQINNRPGFFLMDSSGTLLKKWRVPDDLWYRYGANLYNNMTLTPSAIYMKYFPYNPDKKGNTGLKDSLTVLKLNLQNDALTFTGVPYPIAMTDSFYYHSQGGHSVNQGHNNTLTIRFSALPIVYLFDYKTDSVQVRYLRSSYQTKKIGYAPVDEWNTPLDNDVHHLNASYKSVLYDKYRKVYYSIFSQNTAFTNSKTGLKNDFDDVPVSIIIADTNFNIMGETLLKSHTYFRNYLVTKDGLLISNANDKNPALKPDVLSYTLFKLEEL